MVDSSERCYLSCVPTLGVLTGLLGLNDMSLYSNTSGVTSSQSTDLTIATVPMPSPSSPRLPPIVYCFAFAALLLFLVSVPYHFSGSCVESYPFHVCTFCMVRMIQYTPQSSHAPCPFLANGLSRPTRKFSLLRSGFWSVRVHLKPASGSQRCPNSQFSPG